MAKRKRSRKTSRRRRIGAVRGGMLGEALGVVGGAVLGGVAKKFIPGSELVKSAAVTAVGLFAGKFIGKGLATGMVAYGGVSLVKELVDKDGKFIAGIEDSISVPMPVAGIEDNLSVISGGVMAGDPLSVISGSYDEEEDY